MRWPHRRLRPTAPRRTSGLGGPHCAPAPEEVDEADQKRDRHRVVEVVEKMAYPLPVLSEHVPEVREREDPGDAPEQRVNRELGEVHPRRARRKGDERAHDGRAAGDKDRELAVLVEPLLRDAEVVRPDAHVLSVAEPEFSAAPETYEVGDPGSHQV